MLYVPLKFKACSVLLLSVLFRSISFVLFKLSILQLTVVDIKAVGHNIGDFTNFILAKKRKTLLKMFFYSDNLVSNPYIPEIWRNLLGSGSKMVKVPDFIGKWLSILCKFTHYPGLSEFSGCTGMTTQSSMQNSINRLSRQVIENFKSEESDAQILNRISLMKFSGKKICVILNRDQSFKGIDVNRDTDIKDLIESIKWLIQDNFIVVRITKVASESIRDDVESDYYIEVANELYSDLLFFKIINMSDLALCSWYGPMEVLRLLETPTFFYNCPMTIREFPKRTQVFLLPRNLLDQFSSVISVKDIVHYVVKGIDLRSEVDLEKMKFSYEKVDSFKILESLKSFLSNDLLSQHHDCEKCKNIKFELSYYDKLTKKGNGVYSYNILLKKEEFKLANFCITYPN